MAGKCRVKVLHDETQPFWMLIDIQECPTIFDVQEKIKERLEMSNISCLLLDGCVLPQDEMSELLRDNDVVHVRASTLQDKYSPKGRKRKHADEDKEEIDSQAGPEGETQNQFTSPENEAKKKKRKTTKVKSQNYASFDCKSFLPSPEHNEYQQGVKTKTKKHKHKGEKRTEKCDGTFQNSEPVQDPPNPGMISSKDELNEGETSRKGSSERAEETLVVNVTAPASPKCNVVNDDTVLRKKRRRHRKKKTSDSLSRLDAAQTQTVPVAADKNGRVNLLLPKWKQPKNRKIVFSTESGESDEAENHDNDVKIDSKVHEPELPDHGIGESRNSVGEKCLSVSSQDPHTQPHQNLREQSKDDCFEFTAPTTRVTDYGKNCSQVKLKVSQHVDGSTKVNALSETFVNNKEMGVAGGFMQHQYQNSLRMTLQHSSSMDKQVAPVPHPIEPQEPNLAEHLKLSPEDRGAKLPPFVKATRLSNGAMLYKRSPLISTSCEGRKTDRWQDNGQQIRKPVLQSHKKNPDWELDKQQQLDTVNTNRSFVMENPLRPNTGEHLGDVRGGRDMPDSCTQEEKAKSSRETIVLTPVYREYSLFPDLTKPPKEGDHIAYKVLEMGEDYTPGISDYKEAQVLGYDASCQCITVKVLQINPSHVKKVPGKFDLPDDENENEEMVTLELSSLFEPKIISS